MIPLKRIARGALVWVLLTTAWCTFIIVLAGRLMAQPIYPVDAFGMLWAELPPEAWTEEAIHKNEAPYTWIDKHTNQKGERCCNDKDCEHLDPKGIEQRRDGWHVKKYGEMIPYAVTKPSEDGHFWICRWGSPVETKCFFSPYSGS